MGEWLAWQIWLAGAILLLISEILTPGGFLLASLGVGALLTAFAARLGLGLNGQIAVFALVSLGIFFALKPVVRRWIHHDGEGTPTGADAYVGREARVIEAIDNEAGSGRVKIGGETWNARSAAGVALPAGTAVTVERRDGLTFWVRPTT